MTQTPNGGPVRGGVATRAHSWILAPVDVTPGGFRGRREGELGRLGPGSRPLARRTVSRDRSCEAPPSEAPGGAPKRRQAHAEGSPTCAEHARVENLRGE